MCVLPVRSPSCSCCWVRVVRRKTYNDPNAPGGQVELSNLYNHAWRLNDGSYVLSDDAAFEPFRDIGVDGKRLEKTQ